MSETPSKFVGVAIPTTQEPIIALHNQGEDVVDAVLDEVEGDYGEVKYNVRFCDGGEFLVSAHQLAEFENGEEALQAFKEEPDVSAASSEEFEAEEMVLDEDDDEQEEEHDSDDEEPKAPTRTRGVKRQRAPGFTDFSGVNLDDDSEDELSMVQPSKRQRQSGRNSSRPTKYSRDDVDEEDESDQPRRRSGRQHAAPVRTSARNTPTSTRGQEPEYIGLVDESSDDDEDESDDNGNLLRSDVVPSKRSQRSAAARRRSSRRDSDDFRYEAQGTRQSGRATRTRTNMREVGEDDVFRSDSQREVRPTKPKVTHAKEVFKTLPGGNKFASRHCQQCDTCGNGSGYGQLIHCQGCSLSYHKQCLGHRSNREHLVTKVGDDDFVLQCRRCVSFARRREPTAPDQGMCQTCREIGPACQPFSERKSTAQVERERAENDGEDLSTDVANGLLNNHSNVLFRCMSCWRGWHYHHLPPKSDDVVDAYDDEEGLADQRHQQYKRDWSCLECDNMPAKISGLIAWRPLDQEMYVAGTTMDDVNEDDMQYLIKWEGKSYFRAQWMPGAWTWGVSAVAMRRAFAKRGTGLPTMNREDAIPEEYLRIDIVLNVKFTSIVETRGEEIDKARIREVDEALIKFKGLGYEDAVWEKVPVPEEGDRWTDFVGAYDDWVMGRYVTIPKAGPLKNRLDKTRSKPFEELEKKKQPDYVTGGELMKYQVDGLNWLYYKWYQKKNAILADEMGLGKTIQIVSFLATLVQEHNCAPFLIVVPNSTCPNWRREIKRWAPSLRVVAYYGSAAARDAAYRYELFPEGSKELKCHVVVTSYDAAADDNCRKFFKSVPWQGLIVDEGQRLKNDKNLLYEALTNMKIPFKVLLTGTPLQNNARELFNLLQFLDDSFNASELELEYSELTKENVPALHSMIRPFFLRRTKAQVLTFMPPMAQIILPVSMSVLQTKLYGSILAKNPDLLRAIFETTSLQKRSDKGNLNNLLMQLRKCLCHPFVYSREIEERSELATVSHRNLVEASGKLQMLSLLLPKLQARGHRVLIFSQFLDMLDIMEDFMDGLGLRHQRLDGTISALEKQKRIDEYNAKDSPLFAFLLSTRAGGVGINLATADTVIILDPDFNPHQDIQALSRAHRIGQKNKVLCFQLMTRASAEERIVQIGRKKMALDHILIERMDDDDDAGLDMESILRYGAAAILEGHTDEHRYDDAAIEKLLDRSQVEDTKAGEDNTAESQFSFARVWANDAASMIDSLPSDDEQEKAPDPSRWEYILKERERVAAEEATARQQALGRGKRVRKTVDYKTDAEQARERAERDSSSDTDFQVEEKSEAEDSDHEGDADDVAMEATELVAKDKEKEWTSRSSIIQNTTGQPRSFIRSGINWANTMTEPPTSLTQSSADAPILQCVVCTTFHPRGHCPLKLAGAEYCNLCGLAHYGVARTCPHIRSETQVGDMLAALKQSPESRQLVDLAKKYLTGVKGTLVQHKKLKAEKAAQQAAIKAGGPSAKSTSGFQLPPPRATPTTFLPPRAGVGQTSQPRPAPAGSSRNASGMSMPPTQVQQSQSNELMQAFHQAAAQNAQNAQNRLNVGQYAYPTKGNNGTGPIPGTSRSPGKPS